MSIKEKTILCVLVFAGIVAMDSCKKDETGTRQIDVTTQRFGDDGGKVYIDEQAFACWDDGDEVHYNQNVTAYTVHAGSEGVSVTIPAGSDALLFYPFRRVKSATANTKVFNLPQVQKYEVVNGHQKVEAPMATYVSSSATSTQFKNLCSLVQITNIPEDWHVLYVTLENSENSESLWGTGTVQYSADGTITTSYSGGDKKVVLDCRHNAQGYAASNTLYMVVPTVSYANLKLKIYVDNGGAKKSCTFIGTHSGNFEKNKIYQYSVSSSATLADDEYVPVGALPGKFSISATQKVWFSKGVLQYKPSEKAWRFSQKQHVYSDNNGTLITPSSPTWIDIFCWGTSGWNSGASHYLPSDSRETSGSSYMPGNSGQNGLYGDYANADWGIYNCIENGGMNSELWRTLTKDEWQYLLDREGRCGTAIVTNINGVILWPDDVIVPNTFQSNMTQWGANTYSIAEFETMEAMGVVFLPFIGIRTPHGTDGAPTYSQLESAYWSSTPGTSGGKAYCFFMKSTPFQLEIASIYCSRGASVRLVCDI